MINSLDQLQYRSTRELIEKIYDMQGAMETAITDIGSGEYNTAIEVLQSEVDKLESN